MIWNVSHNHIELKLADWCFVCLQFFWSYMKIFYERQNRKYLEEILWQINLILSEYIISNIAKLTIGWPRASSNFNGSPPVESTHMSLKRKKPSIIFKGRCWSILDKGPKLWKTNWKFCFEFERNWNWCKMWFPF